MYHPVIRWSYTTIYSLHLLPTVNINFFFPYLKYLEFQAANEMPNSNLSFLIRLKYVKNKESTARFVTLIINNECLVIDMIN